jgi:hypothetical protein
MKEIRRFGIPALLGSSAISVGVPFLTALFSSFLLMLTLIVGYGDKAHRNVGSLYYPYVYAVGLSYGLALFPLSAYNNLLLIIIPSLVFGTLTLTSQVFRFPDWKFVEIATGASVGYVAYEFIKI